MGYFRSRGLRGSNLEEFINRTNTKYREQGLGLIQKIPTPIKPVELDVANGNIKKAYFEERSTVDYIGIVQGYSICFDAKETSVTNFPLKNIHLHQLQYMDDFQKQGGIAFFIIAFTKLDKTVLVPFEFVQEKVRKIKKGGRKSISYEEVKSYYPIAMKQGYLVHYLEALDQYIQDYEADNDPSLAERGSDK